MNLEPKTMLLQVLACNYLLGWWRHRIVSLGLVLVKGHRHWDLDLGDEIADLNACKQRKANL